MCIRRSSAPLVSPSPLVVLVASLAGSLVLAGCGSGSASAGASPGTSGGTDADGKVRVVASTDVWGDVVAQIGGGAVDVTSIIDDPSQDPHSFEADADTLLAVKQAALVVRNGGGYDDFVQTMLDSSGSAATVLDAVDVSGKQAPEGGELNEHVWYDFPSVQAVARQIAVDLTTLDPGDTATFRTGLATFEASVGALEKRESALRSQIAGSGGGTIAITEPVPLYLTSALGLTNRTPAAFSEAVEEGDDVSAQVLAQTLALMSGPDRVGALVYNEQTSGPVTEQVLAAARSGGVAVVPVTETLPAGEDYQSWMGANLDHLARAFS